MIEKTKTPEPAELIDIKAADKAHMQFEGEIIQKVFEDWVNNILSRIWTHEEYGIKPAKSEEYGYIDTPYPVHVLNGFSTVLSLVDHALKMEKYISDDLERCLRHVGIAFSLHDYNKLYNGDKSMQDAKKFVIDIAQELQFDKTSFYPEPAEILSFLVISTEQGTAGWEPNHGIPPSRFEMEVDLLRGADLLSTQEESMQNPEKLKKRVIEVWKRIWGENIKVSYIRFNPTPFYAIRGAIEQVFRIYIYNSPERTLVASNSKGAVFLGPPVGKDELDDIGMLFRKYTQEVLNPVKTVKADDRRFETGIFGCIKPTVEFIKRWALEENNFKNYIRISTKEVDDDYRQAANRLNEVFRKNDIPLKLSLKKSNFEWDSKNLNEQNYKDFLLSVAVLRIYQLLLSKNVSGKSSNRLDYWEKKFRDMAEEFKDTYEKLLYYRPHKSEIIPLMLAAQGEIDDPESELEHIVNIIEDVEGEAFDDFEELLREMISLEIPQSVAILDFDEMPSKSEMCLVTGQKATRDAKREVLQGINTQTFTNRAVTKVPTERGKVSKLYVLESRIRKEILPGITTRNYYQPTIFYASTSAFVPKVNLGDLLSKIFDKREGALKLGNIKCSMMNDSALYAPIQRVSTLVDAVAVIYNGLRMIHESKLQVMIRTTNELIEAPKKNIFSAHLPNPEIALMGYDEVNLSVLEEKIEEMNFLNRLGSSKNFISRITEAITSYLNDPLSLYSLADQRVTKDPKSRLKYHDPTRILLKRGDNVKEIKKIAQAAYKIQKVTGKSRSDRTWLFREPLEIIETEVEGGNSTLDTVAPVIAGHVQERAQNRDPPKWKGLSESLETASMELAHAVVAFVKEYWNKKLPDDEKRRNAINAFQFIFASLCFNKGEWKYE